MLGISGHCDGPPLISKHLAGRVQVHSGWGGKYLADGWTERWEEGWGSSQSHCWGPQCLHQPTPHQTGREQLILRAVSHKEKGKQIQEREGT